MFVLFSLISKAFWDWDWLFLLSSKFMIFCYSILHIFTYSYNNRISSIIFCCFSGDMYFSFGISLGCVNVSSIFASGIYLLGSSRVLFEAAYVISSVILSQTRSPVASAVFYINLSDAVLSASAADTFSNLSPYFLQKIKLHNLCHLWVQ